MKKIKVLIAGAGPVGLSAALFLSSNPNVSLDIIEKRTQPNSLLESKALAINPRTMSIFTGYPIQKRLIEESIKMQKLRIYNGKKLVIENNINESLKGKTKFPNMFIYPQSYTEKLLQEEINKLNIHVKNNTQLTHIQNKENHVSVKFNNQKQGHQYDYVIGADGARSIVRKQLGFKFEGTTLDQEMFIYDYQNHGEEFKTAAMVMDNPRQVLLFPVKGKTVRVVANTSNFKDILPPSLKLADQPIWKSSFKINNRHVDKMNTGRVFLVGDAAHVHAPIGGRGMNLGIQDAFVFSHLLREGKLDKYNQLRLPVIQNFVNRIKSISPMLVHEKKLARSIFPFIGPILNRFFKDKGILFVTGLDHEIPYLPKL